MPAAGDKTSSPSGSLRCFLTGLTASIAHLTQILVVKNLNVRGSFADIGHYWYFMLALLKFVYPKSTKKNTFEQCASATALLMIVAVWERVRSLSLTSSNCMHLARCFLVGRTSHAMDTFAAMALESHSIEGSYILLQNIEVFFFGRAQDFVRRPMPLIFFSYLKARLWVRLGDKRIQSPFRFS